MDPQSSVIAFLRPLVDPGLSRLLATGRVLRWAHATAFISFGSIPGSGMAESQDYYLFNFRRIHLILFHLYHNFVSWHFSPFYTRRV